LRMEACKSVTLRWAKRWGIPQPPDLADRRYVITVSREL
jgi:hypothetical protein